MGTLMVITVPAQSLPEEDRSEGYAVVLGDCIHPGHYLGRRYPTLEEADEACRFFASEYGLKAYPLEGPWTKRAMFKLIKGGKS